MGIETKYKSVTMLQGFIAATLTPNWMPIDAIIKRARLDTNDNRVNRRVRWENLISVGILEVAPDDRTLVRRGANWHDWWKGDGDIVHAFQMLGQGTPVEDII